MSGWFGQSWGAPICDETPHVPTPRDAECPFCEQPILAGDLGMALGRPHADSCPAGPMGQLGGDCDCRSSYAVFYHRLCFALGIIPCGMWDDEMVAHADKIGYQHAGSCQHQPRKDGL